MHYTKRIIALTAAAVPVCSAFAYAAAAYAVEAPTDIHLTVQTREISIDEIPADRVVTLDIYQENCPQFDSILFAVTKDPRLSFYPESECFSLPDGMTNARYPDVGYYTNNPDLRECSIFSSVENDDLIGFGDAIAAVSFKLPDQVSPGDFFSVDLVRNYDDTPIQINLGRKRSDSFTESAFSQLNSGGILITQNAQPAMTPEGGGGARNTDGNDADGNDGGEPQEPVSSSQSGDDAPVTAAAAAAPTAVAATTASATASAVISMTSTTSSTSDATEKTTTMHSSTASSQTTASGISTGAAEDAESRNKSAFLTIAMITLIVVAVVSAALLSEKLRMRKNKRQ